MQAAVRGTEVAPVTPDTAARLGTRWSPDLDPACRYPGRAMSAVYLDHAATTPMHPAAIEAMTAALAPSATHRRCIRPVGRPGAGWRRPAS